MTAETINLPVVRFRTPAGSPTCSTGSHVSTTCRFLGHRHFGTEAYCLLEGSALERDNNGLGYLIPHDACIVWKSA